MILRTSPALDLSLPETRFVVGNAEGLGSENDVLVMGGDGTLLSAIHELGRERLYIPMNMGTRGYLTNRSMNMEEFFRKAREEGIREKKFNTLEMDGGGPGSEWAFNEFAVQALGGQAANLRVCVNGFPTSEEPVIASGVIVSTAQGSTGYAFSAGGSCLSPTVPSIGVTFICPYHPRVPPIVVDENSEVTVEILNSKHRPCHVTFDGSVSEISSDLLRFKTSETVRLGYLASHDFIRRMIGKVVR